MSGTSKMNPRFISSGGLPGQSVVRGTNGRQKIPNHFLHSLPFLPSCPPVRLKEEVKTRLSAWSSSISPGGRRLPVTSSSHVAIGVRAAGTAEDRPAGWGRGFNNVQDCGPVAPRPPRLLSHSHPHTHARAHCRDLWCSTTTKSRASPEILPSRTWKQAAIPGALKQNNPPV